VALAGIIATGPLLAGADGFYSDAGAVLEALIPAYQAEDSFHFESDEADGFPCLVSRLYCAISGVELTIEECDLDHYGDQVFVDIANAWRAKVGGFQNVALRKEPLRGWLMGDRGQRNDWVAFHDSRAKLRPLRKDVHQFRTKIQQREGTAAA